MSFGNTSQNYTRHLAVEEGHCFLMAFKPIYAFEIIRGVKKCEVRTYMGQIPQGSLVLIYASSPLKAVIGCFKAGKSFVISPSPNILSTIHALCGDLPSDNEEFILEHYASGTRRVLILEIENPIPFQREVSIWELKSLGIKIPVSYLRITKERCIEILRRGGALREA